MMDRFNRKSSRYKDGTRLDHAAVGTQKDWNYLSGAENAYEVPNKNSEGLQTVGSSLGKSSSKVFAEDYKASRTKILDPNSSFVQQWNRVFLVSCLVALFVDPLFFFLPEMSAANCITIQRPLEVAVTVLRTITDTFYLFHMALQFRTAYVAPSSRVFGRGVLVVDPTLIAKRYLLQDFWLDLLAVLPIPQVVIWIIVRASKGPIAYQTKNALRYIIFLQYIPRLYLIFPLTAQIVKTSGMVTDTAWAGAAYNLGLYVLASEFIGACWYLLSIERKDACWRWQCKLERRFNHTMSPICNYDFLYCGAAPGHEADILAWQGVTQIFANCNNRQIFNLGIYQAAYTSGIVSASFGEKYLYCLWWGLQQLSSIGQNLQSSTFIWEVLFCIFLAIVGLVLFTLLIGNMQTYLQSLGVRLEEWRVKQGDTEEWMKHRQLPPHLRERVRGYNQYKWVATRGVDEESLFQGLPLDLRRDIKRHLCLDLVLQVPLFREMDDRLLDAICERLKPVLCTKNTEIMREGDPVSEMLFIIRGVLYSVTTNGGRTGFFNQISLGPGHFCGEELLTWVLNPKPSMNLPTSTRTVQSVEEVEAFALTAEDLKFVAKQFRRLHSKKLQHTFRFYSHQWRTWAACIIQTTWKRYKKRKSLTNSYLLPETNAFNFMNSTNDQSNISSGATVLPSRFAKNGMRGMHKTREISNSIVEDGFIKVPKPEEPDFDLEGAEAHYH